MYDITRREMLNISAKLTGISAVRFTAEDSLAKKKESSSKLKLKIIVAGAHPDDPETGCGGTMAKFANLGHDVVAFYLTRGERGIHGVSHDEAAKIRTEEAYKACEILKARPVFATQINGACEVTRDCYSEIKKIFFPTIGFVKFDVPSTRQDDIINHY